MLNILFSPQWFHGQDILIDIVSVIVLAIISMMTFQYHRYSKKQNQHLFFSIATALLALSFVFKIMTNFTLYEQVYRTVPLGFLTLTYKTVHYSDTLFLIGALLYRLFALAGFYLLYLVYAEKQSWYLHTLMVYFMVVSLYFTSHAFYIFHLTTLLLLLPLLWRYYSNYRRTKDKAGKLITWSFALIAASQLAFIFLDIDDFIYVLAEGIQLVGYCLLLISFILVLRYGKKKK